MFNWVRLLRAPSNLALNVSRDGASTASLGNRFQCSNTPSIKNFFLTASLMASSLLLNLLLLLPPSGWHGRFGCCLASAHYSLYQLGWRICREGERHLQRGEQNGKEQ